MLLHTARSPPILFVLWAHARLSTFDYLMFHVCLLVLRMFGLHSGRRVRTIVVVASRVNIFHFPSKLNSCNVYHYFGFNVYGFLASR